MKEAWPGFSVGYNYASLWLVPVWILSIAGIWSRWKWLSPVLLFGSLSALLQGVTLQTGQSYYGLFYVFAGVLSAILVSRFYLEATPDSRRAILLFQGPPILAPAPGRR